MFQLFLKGGPLMWPLLLVSLLTLTVVLERLIFLLRERSCRQPEAVDALFARLEAADPDGALRTGEGSRDYVVRTLVYALRHRERSLNGALLRAAGKELQRFNQGLPVLDTVITLAPLLGLLGTVTGMIRAFSLLGASELRAPVAITGGIAEALIATAFGLGIAITALIPFNYLNTRLEAARLDLEDAANRLEVFFTNHENPITRE